MPPERACEVCGQPVVEGQDYVEDFFGGAAHADCLDTVETDEEEDANGSS